MLTRHFGFLPVYFLFCFCSLCLNFETPAARAQVVPRNDVQRNVVPKQAVPKKIQPYPLPAQARQALCTLAGESDVLILGELHGSQEVPAVAAALLAPLTKSGYGVLALEIPADQQGALTDWATGKTKTIPNFFARPVADGRGNIQALTLIRTALSAPFGWKLICFDESQAETAKANAKIQKMDPKAMSPPFSDEFVAVCVGRDAAMAANLASQRARLAPAAKVLAICGNFHAETSNHSAADRQLDLPADDSLNKFWPSFAAALENFHPDWRVRSVNIVPHSGGYFASASSDDGGTESTGVQTVYSTRHFAQAEAQRLDDDRWNWELNLPRVTPVTFLAEPTAWSPSAASPAPDSVAAVNEPAASVAAPTGPAPKELPPSESAPIVLPPVAAASAVMPKKGPAPAVAMPSAAAPKELPMPVPAPTVGPPTVLPASAPKGLPVSAPMGLPKSASAPNVVPPPGFAPAVVPPTVPASPVAPPTAPSPTVLPKNEPAPSKSPPNAPMPKELPPNAPAPTVAPPTVPAPTVLPKNEPAPDVAPPPAPAPAVSPPAVPAPPVAPPTAPAPTVLPKNEPAPSVAPPTVPAPKELPPKAPASSESAPNKSPPNEPAPKKEPPPTVAPPSEPAPAAASPNDPTAKPASPPPTPPGRFRGMRPRLFRFR
jgi:hypothetical protein